MRYSIFALAAAIATVSAQDDCQDAYTQCIAAGQPEVKCSCDLTTCSGEDAARIREYCATATAGLASSTFATATSTGSASIITGTAGSQPSGQPPITAAEGSLALGETCSDDRQCAGGAECWGSTAWLIRRCGNFNAGCDNDSQCAYNTCNNGLCNGFLPSSAYPAATQSKAFSQASSAAATTAAASSAAAGTQASQPSAYLPIGSSSNGTASAAPTGALPTGGSQNGTSPVSYTGSASIAGALSGVAALIAGVVAFLL